MTPAICSGFFCRSAALKRLPGETVLWTFSLLPMLVIVVRLLLTSYSLSLLLVITGMAAVSYITITAANAGVANIVIAVTAPVAVIHSPQPPPSTASRYPLSSSPEITIRWISFVPS